MKHRIVYLMSGPAHLPYLICSLRTLRNHWPGCVEVHAWPESFRLVSKVAETFSAVPVLRQPTYRGKNAQFIDKIKLVRSFDGGVSLYLDADTTVHGDLEHVFHAAEVYGFAATQFNAWTTRGGIVRGRIERLREFPAINQALVEEVLTSPWPSVNGGVFACRPDSPVLSVWQDWTFIARKIFIADETVLHVLQPRFWADELMWVCQGGRWNCSPKYQPKDLADQDVVIWHYHGDSNTRPNKSKRGCEMWLQVYRECWDADYAGIQGWYDEVGNTHLDRLEKERWRETWD